MGEHSQVFTVWVCGWPYLSCFVLSFVLSVGWLWLCLLPCLLHVRPWEDLHLDDLTEILNQPGQYSLLVLWILWVETDLWGPSDLPETTKM